MRDTKRGHGATRQARDRRAVWRNFPGFRANIKATVDGKTLECRLQVSLTGSLELNVPAEHQFAWVKDTLQSTVNHRLSCDEATEHVSFADDQANQPLGRRLKSTDPSDINLWRVKAAECDDDNELVPRGKMPREDHQRGTEGILKVV